MGKTYGCSPPFLQPDPRFKECRLDQMDEARRIEMRTHYSGKISIRNCESLKAGSVVVPIILKFILVD